MTPLIADAYLGCYGRLHSHRCDGHRKDTTRQARVAETRSDALQASHARVSFISPSEIRSFKILADKRFYPGVEMPTVQLIGPGSSPSILSAINAPECMDTDASPAQEPITSLNARPRAPRVTGSFDHPILPMPPVGIVHDQSVCPTDYFWIQAQDNDTSCRFPFLLCNCCQRS